MYVHLVSATMPVITSFHDVMRRNHHFVTVISSGERFMQLITGMPVTGIFCIDLESLNFQPAAILQLMTTQSPAVAKIAILFIGTLAKVPSTERQLITQQAIPVVALPLQDNTLLPIIKQLESKLPPP